VIDFTSSLYLGLRHASTDLRPWSHLTVGKPAALWAPPASRTVAEQLAALVGCERASLGPSTLHLFWDLFASPEMSPGAIFVDAATYPIARWGTERAALRGIPVRTFPHHDVGGLIRRLRRSGPALRRPIVVADGLCPGCGGAAPVRELLGVVRRFGGTLVLDDTQALGIAGQHASAEMPYGVGGGGSLCRAGAGMPDVVLVSSLAKGFGAPLAVLAGTRRVVGGFETTSQTRVHCSPPSMASLAAAERALAINGRSGDHLRRRLLSLVLRFRHGIAQVGAGTRDLFPVQTLDPIPGLDPFALSQELFGRGIRTVLHRPRCGSGARVSLLITALHGTSAIDAAVEAIGATITARRAAVSRPLGGDRSEHARSHTA